MIRTGAMVDVEKETASHEEATKKLEAFLNSCRSDETGTLLKNVQKCAAGASVDLILSEDWRALFTKSKTLDEIVFVQEPSAEKLTAMLFCIYEINGTRSLNAFITAPREEQGDVLLDLLAQLPPEVLGLEFHMPSMIANLKPPSPLNYECVAALALQNRTRHFAKSNDHPVEDVVLAGIILVYGSLNDADPDLLRQPLMTVLKAQPSWIGDVFVALSKYGKCAELFKPALDFQIIEGEKKEKEKREGDNAEAEPEEDAEPVKLAIPNELMTALAAALANCTPVSDAISLLTAWHESGEYTLAIQSVLRADTIKSEAEWISFIVSVIGANLEAFGTLVSLLLSPVAPEIGLGIVAAVAMLTQTIELPEKNDQVQTLQLQLLNDNPRLINFGQGHDEVILANKSLPAFPSKIELEMRSCFQRMYEQQLDIPEVVSLLERLKRSEQPEDQDLFACMVHSLFDEYHFFPQYPVKALATTAVLFGSLVHFRLIEGIPLAIALKFVLDALRHPVESNMFRFGLQALVEMRPRLPEFPKYCKALLQVPGLQVQPLFLAELHAYIDPKGEKHIVFKSLNSNLDLSQIESLGSTPALEFLVNNLTQKTLASRADEIAAEVNNLGGLRFALVLVNRAVMEPNFHSLYSSLLDVLPAELGLICTDVCLATASQFLSSQDLMQPEVRMQLRNVGQFLGMITLAKNRPILFHQICFRLLLAEGANYEKLPAVLPFVTKILSQANASSVFTPQNPWMSEILAVLSEFYTFGNLKLTLRFDIEVLGQALGVKIENIEPAVYFRDEVKRHEDANLIAASITGHAPPTPTSCVGIPVNGVPHSQTPLQTQAALPAQHAQAQAQAQQIVPQQSQTSSGQPINQAPGLSQVPPAPGLQGSGNMTVPPAAPVSLASGTAAPPGIPLAGSTDFIVHPVLRQLLDVARSKTLQDVLLPVVDRSVSIASCAAKELVSKDFGNDPDDMKLRRAAHSLATSLAPAMSLVTAKDPFVEALAHNLRTLVISYGFAEAPGLMDQIIPCARETLESLLPLMESVAQERASLEVEESLAPVFALRQQRRLANQLPSNTPLPPVLANLPRLLQTNGVITDEQMRVYERFEHTTLSSSPTEADLVELAAKLQKLESVASSVNNRNKRISDLGPEDETLVLLSRIVQLANNGAHRSEEIPLRTSQLVVQSLFGEASSSSVLLRECLCYALGELCRMPGVTAKEVVLWLLYADDDKKHNSKVIGTLLRSRLVTPAEIDASLAKDLADAEFKPQIVDFAARLLLDALIGPEPYCLRSDFAGSLSIIASLDQKNFPSAKIVLQALQDTRGKGGGNEGHVFAEWTRLMQHHATANSPHLLHAFVHDLHAVGYLEDAEQLNNLLTTAIGVSVRSYEQSHSFVGVDAVATLIGTVAETCVSKETPANSPEPDHAGPEALVRSMLSTVSLAIIKDHSLDNFDSLPYYRLLSSVACSLPTKYLGVLSDTVISLHPFGVPSFTASWVTLASHRFVMGRLLENEDMWPQLKTIIACLFQVLREIWLTSHSDLTVRGFTYRAIERICLVILHDEPGFFLRYQNDLSPLLVSEFMQLRNLVQSAFPLTTTLPDPSNLDQVSFSALDPNSTLAMQENKSVLSSLGIRKLVDQACRRQNLPVAASTISTAISYKTPIPDKGVDFVSCSVSMVAANALVAYAASLAVGIPVEESGSAALLSRMLTLFPATGRYFVISAIINQLKYAEKTTEFCIKYLLALFLPYGDKTLGSITNDVRHNIVRALLERLVAHRPHPWGITACFMSLLQAPEYKLWDLPFIKDCPEVASLFATLAPNSNTEEKST